MIADWIVETWTQHLTGMWEAARRRDEDARCTWLGVAAGAPVAEGADG